MAEKKPLIFVLVALLSLNVLAWIAVFDLSQQPLEVTFFDVGQGDAIFIETPEGHQVLIDGGPDSTIFEKLGKEMPFWDRTIDLIVLTHPEHDHAAGLIEVLKRYKVENILWTGVLKGTAEFEKWQELIEQERADVVVAENPLRIDLNSQYIDVLYPFDSLEGQKIKNINNSSAVLRLVCGEKSFLFTGDIYKSAELDLVEFNIDSDVLKVSHHGSKTSSAPEFIEAVSPEIAVIQCGKDNSYGHPHKETLDTLEKYDIDILRTDFQGDVKILCNSQSLKLKSQD